MLETARLGSFRTIVEAGGLRRAADLLHVTPGALSKAMAELERELGRRLFVRAGRHNVLTDAGRRLYDLSGRVLQELDELRRAFESDRSTGETTLRLASFEVFTTYGLGQLVAETGKLGRMQVLELPIGRIEDAVATREADFGITYVPYPRADLRFDATGTIEFGVWARRGAFVGVPLSEVPFAVPTRTVSGSPTQMFRLDGWPDGRFPRRIRYELALLESGLELARRGLCAVFIPDFVAELQNARTQPDARLDRRPLPRGVAPVRQTVWLVSRVAEVARGERTAIASALRRVCRAGPR